MKLHIVMYAEDLELCRRIGEVSRTMFYPNVSICHEYEKCSYKNKKLLKYHICSMVKNINKWGWCFDRKRDLKNEECVKSIVKMKKEYLIFSGLSLLFVVYNCLTLQNVMPWIDEGMFIDPAANYVLHGQWYTTAWGAQSNCTYMPLYQFIMVGWMKIFGFSFMACRTLNLLLMFLLGIVSLHLMAKINGEKNRSFAVVIFGLLFWAFTDLAWMYRNGRVDILGALLAFLLLSSILDFVKSEQGKPHKILVWAVLLVMSGIQACMFVGALFVFFIVAFRPLRRRIVTSMWYVLGGMSTGFVLTAVFMWSLGNLKPFIGSFINYSATLKNFYALLRPHLVFILGEQKPVDPETIQVEPSFLERLLDAFSSTDFLILLILVVGLFLLNYKRLHKPLLHNTLILLFIIVLFIPLFMNLAGRFAFYYRWMCYMPLLFVVALTVNRFRGKWTQGVACCVTLVLVVVGIDSWGLPTDRTYRNMAEFIHRQPFRKQDKVVATFPIFYEVKQRVDSCFFLELYSLEKTPVVDYIICPTEKGKSDLKTGYYLQAKDVFKYMDKIKADSTKTLVLIDEVTEPGMYVYAIRNKE